MTDRIDSIERVAASLDAAPRVVLTVRLYGHAHELLVQEFASVGRRRRAARATQLMLVGLLCERANLRTGLAIAAIPPPVHAARDEPHRLRIATGGGCFSIGDPAFCGEPGDR